MIIIYKNGLIDYTLFFQFLLDIKNRRYFNIMDFFNGRKRTKTFTLTEGHIDGLMMYRDWIKHTENRDTNLSAIIRNLINNIDWDRVRDDLGYSVERVS